MSDLFLALRPKVEAVEVAPGVSVYLRELTGADRAGVQRIADQYEKDGRPNSELVTHLVLASVCDQDGKKLYTAKDFDAVNALPAGVLDAVAKAANRLNALDVDAAKND